MAKFKHTEPPRKPQRAPQPQLKQDNQPADAKVVEILQQTYDLRKRRFYGVMRVTLQRLVPYLIANCPPELVPPDKGSN